jgi:hypothetical protein
MTRRPRLCASSLLALATAFALPAEAPGAPLGPDKEPGATSPSPPLRILITRKGVTRGNCQFAAEPFPEQASGLTPVGVPFDSSQHRIFGRCFFPPRLPAIRPYQLVEHIKVGRSAVWDQSFEQPLPAGTLSHLVDYGELLRTQLAALPRGSHTVTVEGRLGGRVLYEGSFLYDRR